MNKLSKLKLGQSAFIENIDNSDKRISRRLRDMGFIVGQPVIIKKKSIFGDPINVVLKGYEIAIRKQEADLITIRYEQEN